MLNCMLKEGSGVINIQGTMAEIMTDTVFLVKGVYDDLCKKDKESGDDDSEVFKKFVRELLPEIPFML